MDLNAREQPFVPDQLLEDLGTVAEMIGRSADVEADRVPHERGLIPREVGLEESLVERIMALEPVID